MKKFNWRLLFPLFCALSSSASYGAESNVVSPGVGLLQIGLALFVVIGLMVLAAWFMKRLGPISTSNKIAMKVIGGISVGSREKIMVVEVADQWLILGVTAHNISNLAHLPKQDNLLLHQPQGSAPFADWLKRTIEKRHAENIEK
ncbi:flagellar biosynthetic protein FliO [Undibacterium sp. SXout7W]|uniref:flagellar biosynthetic protein FliO n=1 Tax=Undibacterium sp. SXout7W TaxID=3413049 RepID=UPI003BF39A0D